MAGEEAVSTTMTMVQKQAEIQAELIKLAAAGFSKFLRFSVGFTRDIEKRVKAANSVGDVPCGFLILQAEKAKCELKSNSNILKSDVEIIAQKSKQYGIPISVTGDDNKKSIEYLSRDEGVVAQIIEETMRERMMSKPQDINHRTVADERNLAAMKEAFEKNNIECQFSKSGNGTIYCSYQSADSEKVSMICADLNKASGEVEKKFKAEYDEFGQLVITDSELDKSVVYDGDIDNIARHDIKNLLIDRFDYNDAQADIAAEKFAKDMEVNREIYDVNTNQIQALGAMSRNIRYKSDSILMRDVKFTAVNFKNGGTHILITNGDNAAAVIPQKMKVDEIKNICVNELGMGEKQAEEAAVKAVKIDKQINGRVKQTTIFREHGKQIAEINRTSNSGFTVKINNTVHNYNLKDKKVDEKIAADFEISEGTAHNISEKARKQSAFANNINAAAQNAARNMKKKALEKKQAIKDKLISKKQR